MSGSLILILDAISGEVTPVVPVGLDELPDKLAPAEGFGLVTFETFGDDRGDDGVLEPVGELLGVLPVENGSHKSRRMDVVWRSNFLTARRYNALSTAQLSGQDIGNTAVR